jgi:hypothetical protein
VQDADRDCEKREGEYKEGMACRRTEEVVIVYTSWEDGE